MAFETLAPNAKFLDLRSSASLIDPKVLALQTSLTNEVDEKSIFEEELTEETNSELEQLEIEPSEVELPPSDDITGTIAEHGFEWLEWPEGSGINYYRKPDSEESWAIWASE